MKKTFLSLAAGVFVLVGFTGWAADCLQDPTEYAAKLENCQMFSCIFEHPFSGEKLNKHILGIENGKCKTQEEMPGKGRMICLFSEKQRKEAAVYLRKTAKAETIESKTIVDIAGGKSKQIEKQDGKTVANPLNAAMQDGTCVVSGYGATAKAAQPTAVGGCQTDDDCPVTCKHCRRGKQICMGFEKESKCLECTKSEWDCKEGYRCNEETQQCVK